MEENNGNKTIYKSGISFVLTFLCSLFYILLTLLLIGTFGILSESHIVSIMNSNDYSNQVRLNFEEEAGIHSIPYGLPEDVVRGIVTTDEVKVDVEKTFKDGFNGREIAIDNAELKTKLKLSVENVFTSQQETMSKEQAENLETYLNDVSGIYSKKVTFPFIGYVATVRSMFSKVSVIGIIVSAVCVAFAIVVISLILKKKNEIMQYISYITTTSGLILTVAGAAGLFSGFYKRLNISPQFFYDFARDYLQSIFVILLVVGLVNITASIVLILLSRDKKANMEETITE